MCALLFNSKMCLFSCGLHLWPETSPIVYVLGSLQSAGLIEEPCGKE